MGFNETEPIKILILPEMCCPFEISINSNIILASPSIISDIENNLYGIIFPLTFSFFGKKITHSNWAEMWISFGISKFLERELIRKIFGEDEYFLQKLIGNFLLMETIELSGSENSSTSLQPQNSDIVIEDFDNWIV